MTSVEAVAWVDKNKAMVIGQAKQYVNYTPYDVVDYVQDAYAAAVEAACCCQNNPGLVFRAVFKVIFKRMVAKITPFPDEAREEHQKNRRDQKVLTVETDDNYEAEEQKRPYYSGGTSSSYPANWRADIDVEGMSRDKSLRRSKVDLEKVYLERVRPHLTEKEQTVMDLAIGTTCEGSHSYSEIGKKLGITRETAKKQVTRTVTKIIEGKFILANGSKKPNPKCTSKQYWPESENDELNRADEIRMAM